MNASPEIIGFDLGKTIVSICDGKDKTPFPGVFRVIKRLIGERFGDRSYIVSKVTPEQQKRAEAWLAREGFHELTGLPADHVIFCAERRDKGPICRRLGITHFIDDRPEVLAHMEFVPHRFLFRGDPADREKFKEQLKNVTDINEWHEVESILLSRRS